MSTITYAYYTCTRVLRDNRRHRLTYTHAQRDWGTQGNKYTVTNMYTCIYKHAQRYYQGIGAQQAHTFAYLYTDMHKRIQMTRGQTFLHTNTHIHNRIIRGQTFRYTYKYMYT